MMIGQRIKRLRKERGYSQRDLAMRSGVSDAFICQVETGRNGIGVPALMKLAKALGTTVGKLVGE